MADQEPNYAEKVPELRELFFSQYANAVSGDEYHVKDIERAKQDDKYVECYLRSMGMDDLDPAVKKMDEIFKYRKDFGINDFKVEELPKELTDREYMKWHGTDLKGHKILIFKIAKHKKGTFVEEVKKHVFYMLDQHQLAHPTERIVLIFDFSGAGITNVDMDVTKFIIAALTTYFPCLLSIILLFEMPMILGAVWTMIKGMLTDEQKSFIKKVKKADITQHIATDQLEAHMVKK